MIGCIFFSKSAKIERLIILHLIAFLAIGSQYSLSGWLHAVKLLLLLLIGTLPHLSLTGV